MTIPYCPSIQIFANDYKVRNYTLKEYDVEHTQGSRWTLPFIRLGVNGSADAAVVDNDRYERLGLPVSEFNGIYHIATKLADFGNPDYIGFCHYRRFFTASTNRGIVPIESSDVDQQIILTPAQQLAIMLSNSAAGIIPYPFLEHYKQDPANKKYKADPLSLAEYYWLQLEDDKTGFTLEDIDFALGELVKFSPDEFKPFVQQAMNQRAVHFGSIFTLRTDLFKEMFFILLCTMNQVMLHIGQGRLFEMNCRCGGYLCERLISVLLWAFKLRGDKLLNMPLVVAEFKANPTYRTMTAKQAGLSCRTSSIEALALLDTARHFDKQF